MASDSPASEGALSGALAGVSFVKAELQWSAKSNANTTPSVISITGAARRSPPAVAREPFLGLRAALACAAALCQRCPGAVFCQRLVANRALGELHFRFAGRGALAKDCSKASSSRLRGAWECGETSKNMRDSNMLRLLRKILILCLRVLAFFSPRRQKAMAFHHISVRNAICLI